MTVTPRGKETVDFEKSTVDSSACLSVFSQGKKSVMAKGSVLASHPGKRGSREPIAVFEGGGPCGWEAGAGPVACCPLWSPNPLYGATLLAFQVSSSLEAKPCLKLS